MDKIDNSGALPSNTNGNSTWINKTTNNLTFGKEVDGHDRMHSGCPGPGPRRRVAAGQRSTPHPLRPCRGLLRGSAGMPWNQRRDPLESASDYLPLMGGTERGLIAKARALFLIAYLLRQAPSN
jgi:hypothetical protein